MELQTAFYIIGIIFMSLMLILFVALVIAIIAIKVKINHIHQMIESKLNVVSNIKDAAKTYLEKKRTI